MNTAKTMSSVARTGALRIPLEFSGEKGERTFQYQDGLASLPQPNLAHTMKRYLESVQPVVSDEEYRHTESLVKNFENGIGKKLHEKFLARTTGMRNWLEKWWDDKAYLEYRAPIVPYINIGGPGQYWRDYLPPRENSQIERAAIVLYTAGVHWLSLRKETLRVDKNRGIPWCMNQYRHIYNSCRTPGLDKDVLHFKFQTESEGPCPSHATVMCRGRLFSFDILTEDGDLLTCPEIERNLQHIRDKCDREPLIESIAPLTSTDRTLWAQRHDYFKGLHPDNERHLLARDSSIMTIALEEENKNHSEELLQYSLGGDCTNRWADKAITLFVFKNGTVGSCCDHAPFDGIAYVMGTHFSNLMIRDMEGKWQGTQELRDLPLPEEHVFHTDDKILTASREARKQYEQACANLDIIQPRFEGFGKDWIRSHHLQPDTFVQVALQYAYYRTYGKAAPTYETATLRRYYHGRTETVRSCTMEALAWSKSMLDVNSTDQERCMLLLKAVQKHNTIMAEAMAVKGCDRHLLALSILAEEEGLPLPDIYTDTAWTKSGGGGNFILSTSFTGYTATIGGAVAMCENGYGAFYCMQPDVIDLVVASYRSCKDTDSLTFYNTIIKCFQEMRELLDTTHTTTQHKL